MAHLPELIQDMALILLVGALVTILFKRILVLLNKNRYSMKPIRLLVSTIFSFK